MALMPSYMTQPEGYAFYGLKALCIFPGNPVRGKDAIQGAVLLYSGETGELLSLMNASAITAIRTAAVSGAATQLLARSDAGELAIIGSGVQPPLRTFGRCTAYAESSVPGSQADELNTPGSLLLSSQRTFLFPSSQCQPSRRPCAGRT